MALTDFTAPRGLTRLGETAAIAASLALLAQHWIWGAAPGFGLALSFAATGLGALWLNRGAAPRRLAVAAGLIALAVLPLLEAVSPLSFLVTGCLIALAALVAADRLPGRPGRIALALIAFVFSPVWRIFRDLWRWRRVARRRATPAVIAKGGWRLWVMPLAMGVVFLALFAAANPVIETALDNLTRLRLPEIPVERIGFTIFLLFLIWPFLRPTRIAPGARVAAKAQRVESAFFGRDAILRALITFNALFLIQTVLDASLLWGGGALPEGMTYASYAHRGAYPLIVTALLAAGFVLIALRPGSRAAESRAIRWLVYLWIGQNVALVASSIYRTDLYIGVYGLTYLRVAALIWMGLVAAGLALIVARIALRRSGDWLIGANMAVLGATLYACCFVNFAGMIASHNLTRADRLDLEYVRNLGPAAIPHIDEWVGGAPMLTADDRKYLRLWRAWRRDEALNNVESWRGWTRRDLALAEYLDAAPDPQQYWREEQP